MGAVVPEPCFVLLGIDSLFRVVPGDAVALHQPLDAGHSGGGNCHGGVTEVREAALEQCDGVDGGEGGGVGEPALHLRPDRAVGDGIQVREGRFIAEYDGPQFLSLQLSRHHHAGESRLDGVQEGHVAGQQLMVDRVAVQHQPAAGLDLF